MIVVSDTTPLHYFVIIGVEGILPRMFSQVLVPSAVITELRHIRAPHLVRAWATTTPSWLIVADPISRLPSTAALDAGEADAISLAKERSIKEILIDERMGRRIAGAEGLQVLPTITILEQADELGLLDFPSTIQNLLKTNFYAPADRIAAAVARVSQRKSRH